MSDVCCELHQLLDRLPMVHYPTNRYSMPNSGIYFFYEKGELWGHGKSKLRIVRVGTHYKTNFASKMNDHYVEKIKIFKNKAAPKDRSIFRKNLGRAIIINENIDYLNTWNVSFASKINQNIHSSIRNVSLEKRIEEQIGDMLKRNFSFRFIIHDDKKLERDYMGLESKLIGTLAQCKECTPSKHWLGNHSPIKSIRESGLWQSQYITHHTLTSLDIKRLKRHITSTIDFFR